MLVLEVLETFLLLFFPLHLGFYWTSAVFYHFFLLPHILHYYFYYNSMSFRFHVILTPRIFFLPIQSSLCILLVLGFAVVAKNHGLGFIFVYSKA